MRIIQNEENRKNYLNKKDYRSLFPRQADPFARLVVFDPLETIIRQGEEAKYLYYMFSGRSKISAYMENGRSIIIKTIEAPCLIGEIELFSSDSSFSVEALSECILLSFPLDLCKDILLKDSRFLLNNCRFLAEKERATAFALSRTMNFPLINRLARFILDNASQNDLSIPKTIISESLGVSYRHLEKVMKDLIEEKTLSKTGKTYHIENKKRLEKLAASLELF